MGKVQRKNRSVQRTKRCVEIDWCVRPYGHDGRCMDQDSYALHLEHERELEELIAQFRKGSSVRYGVRYFYQRRKGWEDIYNKGWTVMYGSQRMATKAFRHGGNPQGVDFEIRKKRQLLRVIRHEAVIEGPVR